MQWNVKGRNLAIKRRGTGRIEDNIKMSLGLRRLGSYCDFLCIVIITWHGCVGVEWV